MQVIETGNRIMSLCIFLCFLYIIIIIIII